MGTHPSDSTRSLEAYFNAFRKNIIGIRQTISTPYLSDQPMVYADWTASGRLYHPIERIMEKEIYPYVGNNHSESSATGQAMTLAYHKALSNNKAHVGASDTDVIISAASGMTGVVNKLQRIMGLKLHERFQPQLPIKAQERPIVFVTHMEHHSNQTSWMETIADVEVIRPDENTLV